MRHIEVHPATKKNSNTANTQLAVFQQSMKLLFFAGQCLGLNSVEGILGVDGLKLRFTVLNWRFLYGVFIGASQAFAAILSLLKLLRTSLSVGGLGYCFFNFATCADTFIFMQVSRKWPELMKELASLPLNEYIDPILKIKSYAVCVAMLILSVAEHILSIISKIAYITDCAAVIDVYDEFLRRSFPSYYESGLPVYKPVAVFLNIMNVISTLTWNYCDVYIVCLSMYLVSILEQINKKINSASEKRYVPSARWRSLREDYCRATRLVRSFDNVISVVIFASFTCNLFIICLQVFNILAYGFQGNNATTNRAACPYFGSGPFGGREYQVYLLFSTAFLFARALAVSLVAASINSASLVPAATLYNVPSTSYCTEVARFIDQVHGDTVALSGLQFFYVTRELVLSVAGTIVTYELVVLQVSGDEINSDTSV